MAKRQIVLDTETTGLSPEDGHRIIEIGCVEIINRRITGNNFHQYINPRRKVDADAVKIHGITTEFLEDKPEFNEIADKFLDYLDIDNTEIIAHNASFDVGFIKYEMRKLINPKSFIPSSVIDTLEISRKLHPGQKHNLDALCKRYKINISERKLHGHGALLDATLLAEAYLRMTGGQATLFGDEDTTQDNLEHKQHASTTTTTAASTIEKNPKIIKDRPIFNIVRATTEELSAHKNYLDKIKKKSGKCVWKMEVETE